VIIYCLRNKVNGKEYVGKTVGSLAARWASHKCSAARGSRLAIHNAIRKYGPEGFDVFELSHPRDLGEMNVSERAHVSSRHSRSPGGYNMSDGGDGPASGYQHTSETLVKLSAAGRKRIQSAETREKIALSHRGVKFSRSHRLNLSRSLRSSRSASEQISRLRELNTGRKLSLETREKMSLAKRGKKKSLETRLRMSQAQSLPGIRAAHSAVIVVQNCVRWNVRRNKPCTCGRHLGRES
jgi:group I intron endonuclease